MGKCVMNRMIQIMVTLCVVIQVGITIMYIVEGRAILASIWGGCTLVWCVIAWSRLRMNS